MDSSLIFLLIIGLWCAFLVPQWMRRRAQLGGSRTRDRFSTAMRVLSRRPRRPSATASEARSYLHRSRRTEEPVAAGETAPRSEQVPSRPAARRRRPPLLAVAVLSLLTGLLLAVPGSIVGAALGLVPLWAPAVAVAAMLVALVGMRLRAIRRRQERAARPRTAVPDAVPASRSPRSGALGRPEQPAAVAEAEAAETAVAQVVPADAAPADPDRWTPVPVPPPTYTLKAQAPRRTPAPLPAPPVEERHEVVQQAAAPVPADPAAAWDLDAVLERRRVAAG